MFFFTVEKVIKVTLLL